MDAVRDRGDVDARHHRGRNFTVTERDGVHVSREPHPERGHVEHAVGEQAEVPEIRGPPLAEHGPNQAGGKTVVAGRHGRVRREDAVRAHRVDELARGATALTSLLFKEAQRQERSMTLVHVERDEIGVAERPQHRHSADPEHDLLPQAVMIVAAVQLVGDVSVRVLVLGKIGVEKHDRDAATGHACEDEPPRADDDFPTVDLDAYLSR